MSSLLTSLLAQNTRYFALRAEYFERHAWLAVLRTSYFVRREKCSRVIRERSFNGALDPLQTSSSRRRIVVTIWRERANLDKFQPDGWRTVTPRIVVLDPENLITFIQRVLYGQGGISFVIVCGSQNRRFGGDDLAMGVVS